ncbi:unnamed protein product [Mycena citricolor]|uniref:DNA replication regulator Sld3 C-terminal domain-containing protein n=1 Tax=Mycena citricolor TaxID=2018698 RepID=A0AAD2H3R6_9AGAR|nr:unnamed protein product [Mycena citricolor]CAK5273629.1 unnamed protein product [Mycena citricolor]
MALKSLQFTLPTSPRIQWTASQDKSISREYPLNAAEESCDDYVARTYFQFLWLPESVMPLDLLIPSLLRVQPESDDPSTPYHPLHAKIERLLLAPRAVTSKYQVDLSHILANGGGEGEEEETMMWYAISHEKYEEEEVDGQEPWLNDAWRTKWTERMQQREVLIQILLHFLKMSLPGPPPPPPPAFQPPPDRKLRKPGERAPPPPPTLEDKLESFMDKLSMWQLVNTLDTGLLHKTEDRDWMQVFCEDVVEKRFSSLLPEQTALLRSKIFPHSPFSDHSDTEDDERSASPEPSKAPKRARSSAIPEPVSSSSGSTLEAPARARSRSHSIILAEEREREQQQQREGSVGARKRVLTREVSMKRAFKPRERDTAEAQRRGKDKEKAAEEKKRADESARLAAAREQERREGVTLVAATPVKARTRK